MTDREKVVKGLKCRLECGCMQEDHCNSDCPYLGDPRACSGLDEDALALLKAQEPHMLSLGEWHNWERLPLKDRRPIFFRDSEGNEAWISPNDQLVINGLSDFGYGSLFAFWTSRPNDEQREATPWH